MPKLKIKNGFAKIYTDNPVGIRIAKDVCLTYHSSYMTAPSELANLMNQW
jgi:hypothetical protein